MMKKGLIIVTMVIMLIGVHSIAQAVYFGLELSDGVNVVTVYDNLAGDFNSIVGVIEFNGVLGTWSVNVTTGISYPVLGSQVYPQIDLNSVNVSTSGAGTLKIDAMALNFTAPGPGALDLEVGGTTHGTVLLNEYYNAGAPVAFNTQGNLSLPPLPLAGNVKIAWVGPLGPVAFAATDEGLLPAFNGPYALTLEAVITHGAGVTITSFDAETKGTQVPEPGIMILLGISMMSLAGLKRYWKD